ncbi:cytochrome C [Aquisediminimonas profunda]|uniref:cytochrome C n=1 Tax=Aquisediminimonas profunda TaxID=1550733 RepID=UPI001FE2E844|nr:cytochrome C [Aquisediminimonas profunda]
MTGTAAAFDAPLSFGADALGSNPRARQNWMLKCQGCHRADATTKPLNAPPLAGEVAKVLSVPGGREYLARVPGVATVNLPSDEVAELLNWTLIRFDPAHVPRDFRPYTGDEIETLRKHPLRVEAAAMRGRLHAAWREQLGR